MNGSKMMYGPQATLIAESFAGRMRYSGASLGYQLSSVIAGGPAPLIATCLLGRYHSGTPITLFIPLRAGQPRVDGNAGGLHESRCAG